MPGVGLLLHISMSQIATNAAAKVYEIVTCHSQDRLSPGAVTMEPCTPLIKTNNLPDGRVHVADAGAVDTRAQFISHLSQNALRSAA